MSSAAEQIRIEIGKHGPISFARFMELALYCPLCGYYEKKKDTTGKRGDFYTNVNVGPLFGKLLAFQFVVWFEHSMAERRDSKARSVIRRLRLIEAGAHDGTLAADILLWLERLRRDVYDNTTYHILEPSSTRQNWQQLTLQRFTDRVNWSHDFTSLLSSDSNQECLTVMFSNELLDAFPVHRLGWDAQLRKWFEWGVTLDGPNFKWTRLGDTDKDIPLASELINVLPDGFITEVCPAAEEWWRAAAKCFHTGKLLTIDYGLETEEFFAPRYSQGTLRGYRRHQFRDDLLAIPGEQDLTAHVNFALLRNAGSRSGLRTETETFQAQFLTGIAERVWKAERNFGPWTPEYTRQFQTLIHPNHLGRSFRVLVQSR